MNNFRIFRIVIVVVFLLECAIIGWQYVDFQKDTTSRLDRLEERQERVKRAVEEHLNGGLGW